jgi:hypothetical protein
MRIDADPGIGEFGHVGTADHDEAGTPQPRHHRRVGVRRRAILLQRARTGAGHLAPDIEQVLDRHRNAGVRRRRRLDLAQPVHRFRRLDRGFGIDANEGPLTLAFGIGDAGKTGIDQLARTGATGGEIVRQRGEGRMVWHGRAHFFDGSWWGRPITARD